MDDETLDSNNVWRDGFVSSFTMILLAEIADKTFFIAAILGWVIRTLIEGKFESKRGVFQILAF